ncbi:hypothetical protein [Mucilaginibacter sp. HD30]
MSHTIIVILICIAMAVWSLYREYRRELRQYLLLRLTATIIAIWALACLILPVTYWADNKEGNARHILLTQGFSKDVLRANSNDSIFTIDKVIHREHPKVTLISDLGLVSAPLQVFGYGLTKDELAQLGDKSIIFHPAAVPDGIVALSWTDKIKAGEDFTVQLKYKNSTQRHYKLLLTGLNTTLDSAIVLPNIETAITLKTKPRSMGKAIYNLLIIDGKDTLQNEAIPVFIDAKKPLAVLILSASPDFETKFLKNWLGENGYGVASRSTITKGKISQEFINTAQIDQTIISAQLLSKFDVLISDQSLLQSLNSTASNVLQEAVFKKGLGIIIRADSAGRSVSWLQREISISRILAKQAEATTIYLQGNQKTANLNTDRLYINNRDNIQALAADDQHHILVAATLAGAGKLVLTTLNNSHTWLLKGHKNDYYTLWSLLINKVSRSVPTTTNWVVQNTIPVVNQPINLELENSEAAKNIEINGTKVYPATDITSLFKKNTTYWPDKSGWQEIILNNTANRWYVWGENNWKSLKAASRQAITNEHIAQYPKNRVYPKKSGKKSQEYVPKEYFFILFLMACTFLWAESKFFNNN